MDTLGSGRSDDDAAAFAELLVLLTVCCDTLTLECDRTVAVCAGCGSWSVEYDPDVPGVWAVIEGVFALFREHRSECLPLDALAALAMAHRTGT